MASRAALFLPELKKAWRACAHSSLGHKGREGSGVPVGSGGPPRQPRTWQDRPGESLPHLLHLHPVRRG